MRGKKNLLSVFTLKIQPPPIARRDGGKNRKKKRNYKSSTIDIPNAELRKCACEVPCSRPETPGFRATQFEYRWLESFRKTTKILNRTADVSADIRTKHLLITSHRRTGLSQHALTFQIKMRIILSHNYRLSTSR